jgi:hypothetical protein
MNPQMLSLSPRVNEEETEYERLSSSQKMELDNLRSRAILRHLIRFTMVCERYAFHYFELPHDLQQSLCPPFLNFCCGRISHCPKSLKMENMYTQSPDSELSSPLGEDSGGSAKGEQKSVEDVEMGVAAPDSSVQVKTQYAGDEDDFDYTHVLIPSPGQVIAVRNGKVKEDGYMDNEKEMKRSSLLRKLFCRKSKVGQDINIVEKEQIEGGVSCTKDEAGDANDPVDELVSEERAVPIFCAVCLAKYEISDRVCWSSNSECSHMFHEDCMLKWLVALGRKRSKRRRFPENPSEKKLLDYDLTCPCCRQNFISRNLILEAEVHA